MAEALNRYEKEESARIEINAVREDLKSSHTDEGLLWRLQEACGSRDRARHGEAGEDHAEYMVAHRTGYPSTKLNARFSKNHLELKLVIRIKNDYLHFTLEIRLDFVT